MNEQTELKSMSILIKLDEYQKNASSMIRATEQHITTARLAKNGSKNVCLTQEFQDSAQSMEDTLKDNDFRLAVLRFMANHKIDATDVLDEAEIASLKPVGEKTDAGRFEKLVSPTAAQDADKVHAEAKIRNLVFTP